MSTSTGRNIKMDTNRIELSMDKLEMVNGGVIYVVPDDSGNNQDSDNNNGGGATGGW